MIDNHGSAGGQGGSEIISWLRATSKQLHFVLFFEVALGGCTQGYLAVPFVIISKIKTNR